MALFVAVAVAAVTISEYDFDYHDDDMGGSGSFGDDVVNVLGRYYCKLSTRLTDPRPPTHNLFGGLVF